MDITGSNPVLTTKLTIKTKYMMKPKTKAAVMTVGVLLILISLLSIIAFFPIQASVILIVGSLSILIGAIYKLLKQKYDEEENLS